MANAPAKGARAAGVLRLLTFSVDDRLYALRAEEVAEVIPVPPVARIPQGPKALLGLANLRGSVVPVASLRDLIGIEPANAGAAARAIVLNVGAPLALVVDSVDAIVTLPEERVETRPAKLGARDGELLSGAFAFGADDRVAKILDIRRLLEAAFASRARPQRAIKARAGAGGAPQAAVSARAAQMLVTFEVAGQEFAFRLEQVQEILPAPRQVSPVPRAETLILGMTSHRDTLLPLLSLRGLLGLPVAAERDEKEKVVVLRVGGAQVGLVADRARAIIAADERDVDAVPAILAARTGGEARIAAIYRGEGGRRIISILAHDQLFREDIMQRLTVSGSNETAASTGSSTERNEVSYLVFRLGDDEFGLPIDAVVEVADAPTQLTRLPKAPEFIEGVINLRGDVLPIVDQRRRFDMPRLDEHTKRRLVVVRTERHRAGLVVDRISDVLRIPADAIEPTPDLTDDTARLIVGVANLEQSGRMVLLLDPAELLTRAERGLLDAFQADALQANA